MDEMDLVSRLKDVRPCARRRTSGHGRRWATAMAESQTECA